MRLRLIRAVAYPVLSYRARDWLGLYARATLVMVLSMTACAMDAIERIARGRP